MLRCMCSLTMGHQTHQRVVSAMIIVDSLSAKFASDERKADISGSAWMPNTDLTPLDPASIDTDDTKGKSKPLVAAFAKASEDNDLQHFKDMLADHQKAVKEEQEAQAERDAKKSAKGKRKSVDTAAAADDEDEMDIDEDEEEPKPKSKKRKKEADSDGEEKVSSLDIPSNTAHAFYSLQKPRKQGRSSSFRPRRRPQSPQARRRQLRNPNLAARKPRRAATMTLLWRLRR